MWERIREICHKRKKTVRILLIIEIILVIVFIAGLFGKNHIYEFGLESFEPQFGSITEDGFFAVDPEEGQSGEALRIPGISLPAGVYQIFIHYDTDTDLVNTCTVTDGTVSYHALLSNTICLFQGRKETDFYIWLLEGTKDLTVNVQYGGSGSLLVSGLSIRETNALNRIYLFILVAVCLAVNGIWLFSRYDSDYGVSVQKKGVILGLALTIIVSSLPLMINYIISSGDVGYHLMRIEGIKDGLLAGQVPVRIAPKWQYGYGYASSIFYGETVIAIAAIFRLIGFDITTSYRMFVFLLNAATALVSYECFRKIFKDRYIGLLCQALYTLSVYRIYKIYGRGALGEGVAILFLPLLLYGFYRVFTEDIRGKSYKRSWIPLTIGFTGLIQSHLLTGELAGGFTILLCLVLWKKVFRRETFVVLTKTVIYSCLLSAWFLVPFMDYMIRGNFVIQNVSARRIQYRGLFPAHHFLSFLGAGGNVSFDVNGMKDTTPASIGIVLAAVVFTWFCLWFFRKRKGLSGTQLAFGKICCWFGILAVVMSLSAFPWDRIQALSGLTATLVSSLQVPDRCLTIATLLLTALGGVVVQTLKNGGMRGAVNIFYGGLAALFFCSNIYFLNDILFTGKPVWIYDSEDMGVAYVAGGEYLPYGTDTSLFTYHDPIPDGVLVTEYKRDDRGMEITCENTCGREGTLELALLYYRGYEAQDLDTGESIPVLDGANHSVTLAVPAGYKGRIQVTFHSPWYWRAAEWLSLIVLVLLLGINIYGKTFSLRRISQKTRG